MARIIQTSIFIACGLVFKSCMEGKINTGLIRLIIAHVHDLLHVITQNSGLKIAI